MTSLLMGFLHRLSSRSAFRAWCPSIASRASCGSRTHVSVRRLFFGLLFIWRLVRFAKRAHEFNKTTHEAISESKGQIAITIKNSDLSVLLKERSRFFIPLGPKLKLQGARTRYLICRNGDAPTSSKALVSKNGVRFEAEWAFSAGGSAGFGLQVPPKSNMCVFGSRSDVALVAPPD